MVQPETSRPTNLLWTAGWDSTYRLLDLVVHEERPVQPWYLMSLMGRISDKYEIRAMEKIRAALRDANPEAAKRILPTRWVRGLDIELDPVIAAEMAEIKSRRHIGEQFGMLASFAKQERITIELAAEKGCTFEKIFEGFSLGEISNLAAEERPVPELIRYFQFPIATLTREDMRKNAIDRGFIQFMGQVWTCHSPVFGRPCGYCRPCVYARNLGIGQEGIPRQNPWRFTLMFTTRTAQAAVSYARSGGKYWVGPKVTVKKRNKKQVLAS